MDLTKAFSTVSCACLWQILSDPGCLPKIIRSFHDYMLGRVTVNGDMSDAFPITNDVEQWYVLTPTLFSLLFATMLSMLCYSDTGIKIHYQTDSWLFDLRHLKARTKVKKLIIKDFLYTYGCALAAHNESDIQALANSFAVLARKFVLDISLLKTEIMLQPAPKVMSSEPFIMIGSAPEHRYLHLPWWLCDFIM